MTERSEKGFPKARAADLVTERVGDELVVYDEQTSEAHCLKPLASAVFVAADGRTSPADLAAIVSGELNEEFDVPQVEMALAELEDRGLVLTGEEGSWISRRQLMQRGAAVGGAAMAATFVTSAIAPAYGSASSGTFATSVSGFAIEIEYCGKYYEMKWDQATGFNGPPASCGGGNVKVGNCSYLLPSTNIQSGCMPGVYAQIDPSGTGLRIYYDTQHATIKAFVYKCGQPSCFGSQQTPAGSTGATSDPTQYQAIPSPTNGYALFPMQCA